MNESKKKNTAVGFLAGVVAAALLFGLATAAFSYRTDTASDAPAASQATYTTRTQTFHAHAASGDVALQQPPTTSPNPVQQRSGAFSKLASLATGQLSTPPSAPDFQTPGLASPGVASAPGMPPGFGAQATAPQTAMAPFAVRRSRSTSKSVAIVAGSAGGGAALGAVAGGKKGAAIGAVSGAVAGLIYDRLTANK